MPGWPFGALSRARTSAGIVRSMFPPRTQVYEGLYPSQIRERFEEDAQDAAAHDWYPVNEAWRGADLYVTYAHDPWRNERTAVADAARRAIIDVSAASACISAASRRVPAGVILPGVR